MRFRFIDNTGIERTADGLASVLDLAKQGVLTAESLVFDDREGRWRRAREMTYLEPESREPPSDDVAQPSVAEPALHSADVPQDALPSSRTESEAEVPEHLDGVPEAQAKVVVELESGRKPWTSWLRDESWLHRRDSRADRTCGRIGLGILVLCAFMQWLLIVGAPNPDAAARWGAALGSLLVFGAVLFFFLKQFGKGRAILILSCLLFCFFGYSVHALVVRLAADAKTTNIMVSWLTGLQRRVQGFNDEVAALKIDSVFEMLDGKRAYERADLIEMRKRVRVAQAKANAFLADFESRLARTRTEIAAIDASTSALFVKRVDQGFPEIQKRVSLQDEYHEEIKSLLEFLTDKSGPYRVTRQGISFDRDDDRSVYNRTIDRINGLAASLNAIRASYLESHKD